MFLGLRLRSGISKAEFAQRFGIPIEEIYGDVIRRYKRTLLCCKKKMGGFSFPDMASM